MPSQFTNQRRPVPPSLAEKLRALGVDPEKIKNLARQMELQDQTISPPNLSPDIDPEQEINL